MKRMTLLVVYVIALCLMDMITTLVALSHGAHEANTAVLFLTQNIGLLPVMLTIKTGGVSLLMLVARDKAHETMIFWFTLIVTMSMAYVVANNLIVLARM